MAAAAANLVTGAGIVIPADVAGSTRALSHAYLRYLAGCCEQFLALEPWLPAHLQGPHRKVADIVRGALGRNQRQMLACFASPTVGTPLHCLKLRNELPEFADRIDQVGLQMMPHLLLEMGLRKLLPDGLSLLWQAGAPPLANLSLGGELIAAAGADGLRFSKSHLAAVAGDREIGRVPLDPALLAAALRDSDCGFRLQQRFWRTGAARLALVDHNPLAAFEAHPDKQGNHIDLGGHPVEQWVSTLDQCFALIEQFMPGEYAEMGLMLHEIVPVGYDEVKHLSASYREAVGTVYLTLHPNVMTMTEAVIHEFQHNKFNVSAYSAEYLTNAFSPLFKSPVRPDPRPLWGILLAVHAFLPVAELYRRMRDAHHPWSASPEFERRMSEIDLKNHEGMEMLRANARLTAAGRCLFDELEALETAHLADRTQRGLKNAPTDIHLA